MSEIENNLIARVSKAEADRESLLKVLERYVPTGMVITNDPETLNAIAVVKRAKEPT